MRNKGILEGKNAHDVKSRIKIEYSRRAHIYTHISCITVIKIENHRKI